MTQMSLLEPTRRKVSQARRFADYFLAHPGEWIDGRVFAGMGSTYAWRTEISRARKLVSGRIENRERRVRTAGGETVTVSEYRWVPGQ